MFTAPILSWVLAAAPEASTQTDALEIARVEKTDTGDVQLVAFDTDGEVVGSVALWSEDGRLHLASDYADGYEETVILDGRARRTSTLPDGIAAERAQVMLDILASSEPQAGKVGCGLGVFLAIAACHPASVAALIGAAACPGAVYHAACECAQYVGPKPPEEWC